MWIKPFHYLLLSLECARRTPSLVKGMESLFLVSTINISQSQTRPVRERQVGWWRRSWCGILSSWDYHWQRLKLFLGVKRWTCFCSLLAVPDSSLTDRRWWRLLVAGLSISYVMYHRAVHYHRWVRFPSTATATKSYVAKKIHICNIL